MKKRITLMLVLALMLQILSACGSTPANDQEIVELTFWHLMDGAGGDALNLQVDQFNEGIGKENNIHVTTVYVDWPGTSAFATAMADGNTDTLPDVFQLYGEMVSYVSEIETLVWAEDYLDSEASNISKSDFIPATLESFKLEGKQLSLPYAISTLLLYYNRDYLEQAGFDAPPATIAEMAAMLPALVEKTPAQYGLHTKMDDFEFENFVTTMGPEGTYITNNHNGRTGPVTEMICQEALTKFLTEWKAVVDTNTVNYTSRSTTEEFATGLDAMALMTSARIANVQKMVGDSFAWGVAPIPRPDASDAGGGVVYGSSLAMFDHSDERRTQATMLFLEYLVSPEAQTILMKEMGYLPVNVATVDYEPYQQAVSEQPQLGVLFNTLSNAPSTAVMTFFPSNADVDTLIMNAIERFSSGATDVAGACAEIIDGCNAVMDEYYRANPIG